MAALFSNNISSYGELIPSDIHHAENSTDDYSSDYLTNSTWLLDSRYHIGLGTDIIVAIVVRVLLALSVLGNSMVLYIYQFRIKPSVFSFYVKVLAALDISTALTIMLLDVIISITPLDESSLDLNSVCKINHFQVYAQSLISLCVFTLIAYQRYRKICHPLEPGLTIRTAKRSLIIIAAVCIPLTIPTLVLNGLQDIRVLVHTYVINVTICRNDQRYEGTIYRSVFYIFLISAFSLILCMTITFYAMVAKAVRKFERRSFMASKFTPSPTTVDIIDREHEFAAHERRQSAGRARLPRLSISGESNNRLSTQMYWIFATITIIFIVSYPPHLLALVLIKSLGLDYKILSFTDKLFLDLAYSCPHLSTVANPIVFGYFNTEFRDKLKQIFCCRK